MDVQEWNDRIFNEVTSTCDPAAPFYLYVDRSVLSRASGMAEDIAFEAFCKAFRESFGKHDAPFKTVRQKTAKWSASGYPGTPPMIAALAMTVLAVTEEPVGAAHALYARQNQLLGREPRPEPPPGYQDDVPPMWWVWNQWLKGPGCWVGYSTARPLGHWTNQGWARSQGLIRYVDRQLMKGWFAASGLRPEVGISGARMVAELRAWLLYRGSRGDRLRSLCEDASVGDLLGEILRQELNAWDGTLSDNRHGRILIGQVAFDTFQKTFHITFELTAEQAETPLIESGDYPLQPGINERLVSDGQHLLEDSYTFTLGQGLAVRAGGEPAYLLLHDTTVGAQVQVRSAQPHVPYEALVRNDVLDHAMAVLKLAGAANFRAAQSPVPTWTRLTRVVLDRYLDDDADTFGLGALAPQRPRHLALHGGLSVGPNTYLCDQPPDVLIPAGEESRILWLDHEPHNLTSSAMVFPLEPQALDPGRHTLLLGEQSVQLVLVPYVNEIARGGLAGFSITRVGDRSILGPFSTDPDTLKQYSLSGGLLRDGSNAGRPVVTWVGNSAVMHILTDEGCIYPALPSTPRWLARIGLPSDFVDAQELAMRVAGSPAFLLIRQTARARLRVVEIPMHTEGPFADSEVNATDQVEPSLKQQLIAELIALSTPANNMTRRMRAAISKALSSGSTTAFLPRPTGRTRRLASPQLLSPAKEWEESRLNSPFDDLLTWLSEQEHGFASWVRLREVWQWLTAHGESQDRDRGWLVQYQLEILGHAESDHDHHRSIVAPAAAVRLSRAGGYAVLCGSRPPEMVRRLMSPGDDDDPAVRQGGEHWFVHAKAQRDSNMRDIGPAALYLKWGSEHDKEVEAGLRALGVDITWRTGDRLLDSLPTLEELILNAPERTMRPSSAFEKWSFRKDGTRDWVIPGTDEEPGLYRYDVFGAPLFAWRSSRGESLRVVDHRVGKYLQLKREGAARILYHAPVKNWLIVPRSWPLPPLVARGLVLRTGQLPLELTVVPGPEWRFPGNQALAYSNVDAATAERVEHFLGLELSHVNNPPEELS